MASHLSHYTLKHRAIATVSRWFDGVTYTVRHGPLTGMKRKGGLGFLPTIFTGTTETAESRFLASLDLSNAVVYDVGGFQGLLTLFFAVRARQVIVYEPNPVSRARLEENLRLNDVRNVLVRPVGIGKDTGTQTLVFDALMPGAASADAHVGGQIRDTAEHVQRAEMQVTSLDADMEALRLPPPTFVKIDVEGMEHAVLQGMTRILRDVRPALHIELHGAARGDKLANALAVYTLLDQAEYRVHDVELNRPLTVDAIQASIPAHIYCVHGSAA